MEKIGQPARLSGTPGQVVDFLGQYAEQGTGRVLLQLLDLAELDHLDVIAAAVMPQLA